MLNNKKGISEITSFVLLTLLIVISSGSAYLFSKDYLDNEIDNFEKIKMENKLKELNFKISSIQNIHKGEISVGVEFKKGTLRFETNKIIYQSLVESDSESFCFDNICFENNLGYERVYFNLSNSYNFSQDLDLVPGSYIFTFKNLKNESKIELKMY